MRSLWSARVLRYTSEKVSLTLLAGCSARLRRLDIEGTVKTPPDNQASASFADYLPRVNRRDYTFNGLLTRQNRPFLYLNNGRVSVALGPQAQS